MNQDEYRALHHFREVKLIETGMTVLVDDLTFNPELHEEIVISEPVSDPPKDE